MDLAIEDKVIQLNSMLSEIDNLYQLLLQTQGMSDSEYIVMFSIMTLGEGCLQKDIAAKGFMSKKTINATIKKLQKENIIELKAGKYPNMHIYLTDTGREFIKKSVMPVIEVESRVLNDMPSQTFELLVNGYSRYIDYFREQVTKFVKKPQYKSKK